MSSGNSNRGYPKGIGREYFENKKSNVVPEEQSTYEFKNVNELLRSISSYLMKNNQSVNLPPKYRDIFNERVSGYSFLALNLEETINKIFACLDSINQVNKQISEKLKWYPNTIKLYSYKKELGQDKLTRLYLKLLVSKLKTKTKKDQLKFSEISYALNEYKSQLSLYFKEILEFAEYCSQHCDRNILVGQSDQSHNLGIYSRHNDEQATHIFDEKQANICRVELNEADELLKNKNISFSKEEHQPTSQIVSQDEFPQSVNIDENPKEISSTKSSSVTVGNDEIKSSNDNFASIPDVQPEDSSELQYATVVRITNETHNNSTNTESTEVKNYAYYGWVQSDELLTDLNIYSESKGSEVNTKIDYQMDDINKNVDSLKSSDADNDAIPSSDFKISNEDSSLDKNANVSGIKSVAMPIESIELMNNIEVYALQLNVKPFKNCVDVISKLRDYRKANSASKKGKNLVNNSKNTENR